MKFLIFVSLSVLTVIFGSSSAVVYTRCQLAQLLLNNGFPYCKLRNWVCLVESENSARDTSLQTNQNGTQNLGLFQINDTNWCLWPSHSTPTGGGGCNALCFNFLTDDITAAAKCALLIFSQQGFCAWDGWKNKCSGKSLPDLKTECGITGP